jgi:hypothetical protein
MTQRPGCLTPIALVFVAGFVLIVAGQMGENARTLHAGVGCLVAGVVLLIVGYWMRQRGWWD